MPPGTGEPSVPLRQPQPHRPRRPARCAGEREDLIMNAPHITRRDFTAGARRHRPVLQHGSAARARPGEAEAARQPPKQPHAQCVAAHQRRRHGDRLHRQGRAGAGHPHGAVADRRRRARSAVCARHDRIRRHEHDPQRRPNQRQLLDREQRHGAAACSGGSALDPAGARGRAARLAGRWRSRSPTVSSPRRTAARSPMASLPARST